MRKHPFVVIMALSLLVATETIILIYSKSANDALSIPHLTIKKSSVIVDSLKEGDVISSPISLTGQARGTWFFEGSFPVVIVDWDGLIIGEGHVQAKSDWMTTGFVPFEGVITFKKPVNSVSGTYSNRGAVILKKDNPSDLPENDDAVEIGVVFN